MKKITEENKGVLFQTYLYMFPCGDIILYNHKDGSCIVEVSDFVTTYTKEEMKEIYNYPMKN